VKIEIKHKYSQAILFSIEIGSLKLAVEAAVRSGAYLRGAYLDGADLDGAYLDDDTRIETGETWKEYKEQVVPALLTAGGKTLQEVVEKGWNCHSWQNCPMAEAFSTHDLSGVPILLRPRAEQFIKFFDSNLLPRPV